MKLMHTVRICFMDQQYDYLVMLFTVSQTTILTPIIIAHVDVHLGEQAL